MDLDLTCLASLLVLYDEQQYGRAAAKLGLTPSALTKRVQKLERQMGVELVTRGQGAVVEPTAAGHRFRTAAAELLRYAEAARRAALAAPVRGRRVLVLGIPGGPQDYLRDILPDVMTEVRANWPGTRLVCQAVPFSALTSSLLGGEVDVLWTAAPVRNVAVVSIPLRFTAARVGLVDAHHELAEADAVDASEFADLPILFNPAVPDEYMSLFYLGDIRPRNQAQLVRGGPQNLAGVAHEAGRRRTVSVAPSMFANLVGPRFHSLRLNGAAPLRLHAAFLRREHRGAVHGLVAALSRGMPSDQHLGDRSSP